MTDKPLTELTDDELRAEYRDTDTTMIYRGIVMHEIDWMKCKAGRRHALGIEMIRRGISP